MVIYTKSANRTVSMVVPVSPSPGTLEVSVYDGDLLVHTVQTVSASSETNTYSFVLPFRLVQSERDYTVRWVFEYTEDGQTETHDETTYVSVVTPILSDNDLIAVLGEESTYDERAEVESVVRNVIQSHTGQKFGLSKNKTLTVEGHGEGALRLPERLLSITAVNTLTSSLSVGAFIIVSDGWYVKKAWADASPLDEPTDSQFWGDISGSAGPFDNSIYGDYDRSDDSVDTLYGPLGSRPGGITVAPGASGRATAWKNDYQFKITGDWGYRQIPSAVRQAALLLANDYACSEAAYRDKYLESIKAADWRLQYSSRSWEHTGNVRADHLLSEYVLMDWAVI